MIYKLVFFLVAALFIQASFCEEDVIQNYKKKMEIDLPIHREAQIKKNEVLTTLDDFNNKIDQLIKARGDHQSDPALESSVQVLGAKLIEQATEYAKIEHKSLETAKGDIHQVQAVIEYLKNGQ